MGSIALCQRHYHTGPLLNQGLQNSHEECESSDLGVPQIQTHVDVRNWEAVAEASEVTCINNHDCNHKIDAVYGVSISVSVSQMYPRMARLFPLVMPPCGQCHDPTMGHTYIPPVHYSGTE